MLHRRLILFSATAEEEEPAEPAVLVTDEGDVLVTDEGVVLTTD